MAPAQPAAARLRTRRSLKRRAPTAGAPGEEAGPTTAHVPPLSGEGRGSPAAEAPRQSPAALGHFVPLSGAPGHQPKMAPGRLTMERTGSYSVPAARPPRRAGRHLPPPGASSPATCSAQAAGQRHGGWRSGEGQHRPEGDEGVGGVRRDPEGQRAQAPCITRSP